MLNWVHIRTIRGPFHDVYVVFKEPRRHHFGYVYRGVILHKNKTWLVDFEKVIIEYVYVRPSKVSLLLRLEISLQSVEIWSFHAPKTSLYHNAKVLPYLVWLYHIVLPLLIKCTKDPFVSFAWFALNRALIAPNNLGSILVCPVLMLQCPCVSFARHFRR